MDNDPEVENVAPMSNETELAPGEQEVAPVTLESQGENIPPTGDDEESLEQDTPPKE